VLHEWINQAVRDRFIALYTNHPTDPARWRWFLRMILQGPVYYYADLNAVWYLIDSNRLPWAPIDTAARTAWDRTYAPIRAAFMADPTVTDDERQTLRYYELNSEIDSLQIAAQRGELLKDSALYVRLQTYLSGPGPAEQKTKILSTYFSDPMFRQHIDRPTQDAGFRQIRTLDTLYARLITSYETLERTASMPVAVRLRTFDGTAVDVSKYRGKVVLLDFWSRTCGTCIGAFPKLQTLYKKYHARGFEILGVALDDGFKNSKSTVQKIVAEHQLPWLQMWSAGANQETVVKQFGIWGVPHIVLLDRQGRIVQNSAGSPNEAEFTKLIEREL